VITYKWHGPFTSTEVSALHEEAFGGQGNSRGVGDWGAGTRDWRAQVERHSLGWVCARDGDDLAGFVNVAWDGGVHAFILDTLVAAGMRRQGIGTRLVALAAREARPGRLRVAARRLRGALARVLPHRLRVHAHQCRAHRPVNQRSRSEPRR